MRISVAATPEVAIPTLEYLLESEHELVSIITQPDRPAGRGQLERESTVATWAKTRKVLCEKPQGIEETIAALHGAELLITIGYGVILPEKVFSHPQFGSINLHFSLLPRWRGAAPVQRAIEAGDLVSGVTVFALDSGMDTGPIYTEMRYALDSDITSDELFSELAQLGPEAIAKTLDMIENGEKPRPQSQSHASRALKISKEDAKINWDLPAKQISQKIRAFTSTPGAWTLFRDSTIKIFSPRESDIKLNPGEILAKEKRLFVGTQTTAIEIEIIQPSGKSQTPVSAWLNGARLTSGEKFG